MATKKNDPVKPKKDKWGRTEGSKYYSFNPETKKYEDPAKAKDYYGRKQDSFRYAVDKALTGEYQGKRANPVEDFSNMLQGKKTKKPNYLELQKKGGTVKMKTKQYKTGGMVNPNASVQASKVAKGRPAKSAEPKSAEKRATGKTGGISKSPKTAVPKAKYGMVMRKK